MKVEVIELFYDKDGVLHQVGEVLKITDKARVERLVEKNLVKVADDEVEEAKPSTRKTATRARSKAND